VLVRVKPGAGVSSTAGLTTMTVLSLAVAVTYPPPDTVIEFDSGVSASDATFTVTVIAG
jgi:hypothetical protein